MAFLCSVSLAVSSVYAAPDSASGVTAVSSNSFLNSLGVNTHVAQGYKPESYLEPLQYLGVRNIRDGGTPDRLPGLLMLHGKAGVQVDVVGVKVHNIISTAKNLAEAGALMAIEGPNEPNNFPVTYQGQKGGGKDSWVPVALIQKELYSAVKNDPELRQYPVFHVSEGGGEFDNVGMQFLTIPQGSGTLMPDGTQFADYANTHNYVSGNHAGYVDNQAWKAADPTLKDHWDGLYVEYGVTWRKHFSGYSNAQLETLPRVTTETGWDTEANPGGERVQGIVLVNTLLAQFKRGWKYTFIYEVGDGEGSKGHQGLYHPDGTPKLAATYIHNLTSILADNHAVPNPAKLAYSIANEPDTVHDLLLQKSNGAFELVVWGEQVSGSNNVAIHLGSAHAKVKIYDITTGTQPVQTLVNVSSIPLTVSDHAMIVEILP